MRRIYIILSFLIAATVIIPSVTTTIDAQQKITVLIGAEGESEGGSSFIPQAADEGVLVNTTDGRYRGFSHTARFSDGQIAMIYKDSENHAAAGALMFSLGDGTIASYNFQQVNIGGLISCANLGIGITSTDRLIIDWQESDSGPIKFAYSDNRGQTWTMASSSFNYPANHSSAQFGKIIECGGGRLLKFYYCIPLTPTDPSIAGCLKSDDNGATWSFLSNVAVRPPYDGIEGGNNAIINGNGWTSEIYGVVTDHGTGNGDTKIAVLLRWEEVAGGAMIHYRSPDGGTTWEKVTGTGSLFDALQGPLADTKYPVHLIEHDGLFYVFAGVRWSTGYKISYVTATSANLYNNTGYSARVDLPYNPNADDNAASNDFGYPEPLSRIHPTQSINEIVLPFYDSTPTNTPPAKNIMIYQIKISF